jgi:hypothetical protein
MLGTKNHFRTSLPVGRFGEVSGSVFDGEKKANATMQPIKVARAPNPTPAPNITISLRVNRDKLKPATEPDFGLYLEFLYTGSGLSKSKVSVSLGMLETKVTE